MSQNLSAQIPDFYREDLTFILDDSSFTVSGFYYFMNTTDEDQKYDMLYPFPSNQHYGNITEVYAYVNGSPLKNVLLHYNDKAAFIKLDIETGKNTMIRIGYTQEVTGDKAEYILTSTKSWNNPLTEVNYTLIIPDTFKLDSLSYEPDFSNSKSGKVFYYYHKENFMPDKEFEVFFRRWAAMNSDI